MINSLTGTVTGVESGELYLETQGGIEWSIQVSTLSLEALSDVGSTVRVLTYLHHRDDQMTLFGFATSDERLVFGDLLKVGGIGPKQALRILSGMSVERLVRSLDDEDVDALSSIPGLGKKTAQKILLTLRGKLSLQTEKREQPADDIVEALADMGFDRATAKRIVASVRAEKPDIEEGEILRTAIVRLSSGQQT